MSVYRTAVGTASRSWGVERHGRGCGARPTCDGRGHQQAAALPRRDDAAAVLRDRAHLFGGTAFAEASLPVAALVWLRSSRSPRLPRAAFHAISDVRGMTSCAGLPRERHRRDHRGGQCLVRSGSGDARAREPTFLYVGRLKRYKGVELAVRALAEARCRQSDIALEIAGQGDDRPRLERWPGELGWSPPCGSSVRDREEKRRRLRRAWPWSFRVERGLGHLQREAAGCGTPALASTAGAARVGPPRRNGLLVPHGDWRRLAERMIALATDAELWRGWPRRARLRRVAHLERSAAATEAHLQRVIAQGG